MEIIGSEAEMHVLCMNKAEKTALQYVLEDWVTACGDDEDAFPQVEKLIDLLECFEIPVPQDVLNRIISNQQVNAIEELLKPKFDSKDES